MRLLVAACWLVALARAGETHYEIATVAGTDRAGDDGPAVSALLNQPEALAVDRAGNLYIADPDAHRVRKVAPGGVITTIAGDGHAGYRGDGGAGPRARLNGPYGVAADAQGNVYIADTYNHRVRMVAPGGEIRAFAGTGIKGSGGDGGPAVSAQLMAPRNVAVDAAGNVYVSEFEGHRVRRIAPDGTISTVAGTGVAGFNGDGNAAASQLSSPAGLALDAAGGLYIADIENRRVRRLANGVLGTAYGPARRDMATGLVHAAAPSGVACDRAGAVYVAEGGNGHVLRLLPAGDTISLFPGAAPFSTPRDLAASADGAVYISDGRRVRKASPALGALVTVAGEGSAALSGDGGPAAQARLWLPRGIALDSAGNLLIAESGAHRIRRIDAGGTIFPMPANPGAEPSLNGPTAVGFDPWGNLLIADTGNHRLRRMLNGLLLSVAGSGQPGRGADGMAAIDLSLNLPGAFATDRAGNVYLADTGNHRIVKITPGGTAAVFAGNGTPGFAGDGGRAANAQLQSPAAAAVDAAGNVYIADTANHRVRKVTPEGVILTVAGDGVEGVSGARLAGPCALAAAGETLWIADSATVRALRAGKLEPAAGNGALGFDGDAGPALEAQLNYPCGLAVDAAGAVYIADSGNHRIRRHTRTERPVIPEPLQKISVLHAASLREGPIAPGQIVSLIGANLGRQVYFDGKPARVFHYSATQINAQVPSSLAGESAAFVEVRESGELRGTAALLLVPAAPALFTISDGAGQALAVNQDGTLNSAANPALKGSYVTLYATGEGQREDGTSGNPAAQPVSLTVAGQAAELSFAGMAPGFPGLMQVNARLPGAFLPGGALEVVLRVGGASSPAGVTIAVK